MTRARLLAMAAALSVASAGVYFIGRDTAELDSTPELPGAFEAYDKSRCSVGACNINPCDQARDILADAGSSCVPRAVECPVRIGPRVRAQAADAGLLFSASPYQQLRLIALRCPAVGGGFAFGVPVDDQGWPVYAVATGTPGCRKRPAGTAVALCRRVDAGDQGDENQGDAADLVGAGCVSVPCGVIAGDQPP